jgi:hypothetical protein
MKKFRYIYNFLIDACSFEIYIRKKWLLTKTWIKFIKIRIRNWMLAKLEDSHRYLMSRLSLQVSYLLWRHVLSTVPPFILWLSNLEILFAPLHRSSPMIGGLRCQAIQTEHGTYIAERTQKAIYIVRCLWGQCSRFFRRQAESTVYYFIFRNLKKVLLYVR